MSSPQRYPRPLPPRPSRRVRRQARKALREARSGGPRRPMPWAGLRLSLAAKLLIAALIGVLAAASTSYKIGLDGIHARHQAIAAAGLHILVADPSLRYASPRATEGDIVVLAKRAQLYSEMLASQEVLDRTAQRLGIPAGQLGATSRLTSGVPNAMTEPGLEHHAGELIAYRAPYRLEIQPDPTLPVINLYAFAPTPAGAVALADASVASLRDELDVWRDGHVVPTKRSLVLRVLGEPRGAVINGKAKIMLWLLAFLVAFSVALTVLLAAPAVARGWRAARDEELGVTRPPEPADDADGDDAGRTYVPEWLATRLADDWPRTTRPLPWLIAAFLAMLWLVPFNTIQLNASLPIDLKFDRLLLPEIFVVWVLALAVGGVRSPRVKLTPIHAGIGLFVLVACFSVVHDAGYLNQVQEFETSFKKISLILDFALFFVLIASVVRPAEVGAFLKYTLGLAVIAALGTIWQYRFHYDVFYDLSAKVLPGFFSVAPAQQGTDEIGRYLTLGPAEHPLECVAMMSMALPVALVGMLRSDDVRRRVLYGLAACILLGAAVSTYRKSALLAPVAIILTLAFYERKRLLRLAPLALVSFVVVHIVSPGALGSVLFQFQPSKLGVNTVSDRASDYDAVRPDLWSHMPFGMGYGSYDHVLYRVLDSEILNRLIDVGVIGLIAFVGMVLSIVVTANRPIRERDERWAPVGLAVAPAAIAYIVLCFLFDVDSFPHTPYILMSLAGLLAVRANDTSRRAPEPAAPEPERIELFDHEAEAEPVPVGAGVEA